LSKVVDVTHGSKTPIFNKKKAAQIIKIMSSNGGEQFLKGGDYMYQKTDLRTEIEKA